MPARPEQGKKQPLLLVAAILSLLATLWAGAWCWAEILAIGPRQQIEYWESQGLTKNQQAIEQVMSQLVTASQINSSNAEFYWLRGRLAALQQSVINNNDSPQAISLFKQAMVCN